MGGNTVVASRWWTGRNWFDGDGIRIMDLHSVDIKGGIRYDVGEFSGIRNLCISGTNYYLGESIQGSLWLIVVENSVSVIFSSTRRCGFPRPGFYRCSQATVR